MEVTGRPREGLIALIPLAVLIAFVVTTMGGPAGFVDTIAGWVSDLLEFTLGILRWL